MMIGRLEGKRKTLAQTVGVVLLFGSLAWASVPLYDWFCRVTGYGCIDLGAEILEHGSAHRVMIRAARSSGQPGGPRPPTRRQVGGTKGYSFSD